MVMSFIILYVDYIWLRLNTALKLSNYTIKLKDIKLFYYKGPFHDLNW